MNNNQKSGWTRASGYVWALIGSAVGFANILSFSAKAYFYGGGAFLIPFTVAMIVLGVPLLFLEGIIGQYYSLPFVSASGKAKGWVAKIFGWLPIFAVTTIGGYYVLLTGWTVAYAYFSATDMIPTDTVSFLNNYFLEKTDSIATFGGFAWIMFMCTIIVALLSWFVVSRKIQSGIERLCVFFLPILTFLIVGCAIIVCFLPGAFEGIKHYFIPNFAVLKSPKLWLEAFGHIFFSLSLGLGIITGYSRHAGKKIDIARSMVWVVIGDFFISFVAGIAIFGCIGYMGFMQGVPFSQLITSASPFEIGFVIFPTILKMFGPIAYRIIGPIFFFSIFIAGVTGVFSIIESIAGNIEVEFGKGRRTAVTIATGIMTLLAMIFCMGNGQYLIGALDPMVAGFNMLIGGLAEVIIFMWLSKDIQEHPIWCKANGVKNYAYYAIRFIVPTLLVVVFITSLMSEFSQAFDYARAIRWSWFTGAAVLAIVFARKKSSIKE